MMYCVKHLMKLHPEYNDMIMPFYAKMYDLHPYNEQDPFNFDDDYKVRPRTSIERHLDELADLNNKEIERPRPVISVVACAIIREPLSNSKLPLL